MIEKNLKAILSQNIKKFRGYRKLSQAEFAEKIDISIPFLSDIENGKKWVSPTTLIKMADAFDIDAYELLKPDAVLPDDIKILLEKYTAEINVTFADSLNTVLKNYLLKLK